MRWAGMWQAAACGALLIGCGGTTRSASDDPCAAFLDGGGGACAAIKWLGETGLDVELTVNADGIPGAADGPVELRWRTGYLGPDYLTDAVVLPARESWPAPAPRSGRQTIRYRITLAGSRDSRFGPEGGTLTSGAGWVLMGRNLVPDIVIGGEQAKVATRFVFDAGPGGLMTTHGPDTRTFEADLGALADRVFVVGRLEARQRAMGETTLYATSLAVDSGPALERYLGLLEQVLGAIATELGPLPTGRFMAAHHPAPGHNGITTTREASIHISGAMPHHISQPGSQFLVHELIHLWLPGRFAIDTPWIREGLTEYLTIKVLAGLNDEHPLRTARTMMRAFQQHGTGTIAAGGQGSIPVGAFAGYCLDTHISAKTDTTLPRLLGALLRDHPGETISAADLEAAVRAQDAGAANLLVDMMSPNTPVDLLTCMKAAGFEAVQFQAPVLIPEAMLVAVMKLGGMSTSGKSDTFVVTQVMPDSQFKPGDRVDLVNGMPVASPDDLAIALNTVTNGQTFEVRLMRDGVATTLTLTKPELDEAATRVKTLIGVMPLKDLPPDPDTTL